VQNSQADLLAILWKIAGGQEGEIRDWKKKWTD
jgi:hypothetical protein